MGMPKPSSTLLLLLLIVTVSASQKQITSEARTLLSQKQKYSKIFSTLGVVCKCCDETGAECATTWTGSCHNLQCLPWKI
ncbi:hypothetical protein POPTR_006G092300v4 [Populus trichocarpa]|uniref:Uncharacterized protein n=1 Tax=Populus trichocarpa TaxID=3694 RepID=A0A2K1ZZF7_POPTR|nr:hypothetical protein BDE02_06G081700 [Populus trichocarpa]PNT30659.1 hypothetical protein POPTR_006G092300v4 [Populus trichocarpa]